MLKNWLSFDGSTLSLLTIQASKLRCMRTRLRPAEYEYHQSCIPLLIRSIFCFLFIIKSVVLALDIFLNNLLVLSVLAKSSTEKPIELDKGQLNMNTVSQAYHS